jgi:uncharacterized membrane protein YfcA
LSKTLVCLIIFSISGLVNWEIGFVLSIDSFFGGYWGSKLAHKENIKKWVYGILIFIIAFEIVTLTVKLFGLK